MKCAHCGAAATERNSFAKFYCSLKCRREMFLVEASRIREVLIEKSHRRATL